MNSLDRLARGFALALIALAPLACTQTATAGERDRNNWLKVESMLWPNAETTPGMAAPAPQPEPAPKPNDRLMSDIVSFEAKDAGTSAARYPMHLHALGDSGGTKGPSGNPAPGRSLGSLQSLDTTGTLFRGPAGPDASRTQAAPAASGSLPTETMDPNFGKLDISPGAGPHIAGKQAVAGQVQAGSGAAIAGKTPVSVQQGAAKGLNFKTPPAR